MNKNDYALLFESTDEKHHIPVEATEQINLYNEVILTASVLRTLSYENIRLALMDKHGDLLGYYIPEGYCKNVNVLIAQCLEYADSGKRLSMARKMELSAIHNIRANVRYYGKKNTDLDIAENKLSEGITELKVCKSIEDMLLVEARCRQLYYETFNTILNDPLFRFNSRSRRPPKDEINALISFGNTLLYNRIQQIIWKTSLDSRIGVFHAANRRNHSLNLDFADIFKPVISDRVIFTLINRGQLSKESFLYNDDGSVLLNNDGKRTFISAFEDKMKSRLKVKEKFFTYHQLIESEVHKYLKHFTDGSNYKPYKYY